MSRYMDRIPAPQTSMMASEHMFTLFCICQDSIHVQVHGSNPGPLDLSDGLLSAALDGRVPD